MYLGSWLQSMVSQVVCSVWAWDETTRHGEEHLIHQWHLPQGSLEAKRMGKKLDSCIPKKAVLPMTKLLSS